MTTIVLDNEYIMASDTQATTAGDMRIQAPIQKIFQIGDYTIGLAGDYNAALRFKKLTQVYLANNEDNGLEALCESFRGVDEGVAEELDNLFALVVHKEGEVILFEGASYHIPIQTPYAIGSGGSYAFGALSAGASAEEAVSIAIQYDVYSGGEVVAADCKQTPL